MKMLRFAAFCIVAAGATASSAQTPLPPVKAPRVFLVDPDIYVRAKSRPTPQLLTRVQSEAKAALDTPPLTVTSKSQTPPSGDKHDYFSMAIFWWPNPKDPTGPYIHRDGELNPETLAVPDEKNLERLIRATHALALSFYMTGNEEHAAHAALLLRAWFLDPGTAMNPSLAYAQGIHGVNDGRAAGICCPTTHSTSGRTSRSKPAARSPSARRSFTPPLALPTPGTPTPSSVSVALSTPTQQSSSMYDDFVKFHV